MLSLTPFVAGLALAQGMPTGALAFESGKPVKIDLRSLPVVFHGKELSIIQAGEATLYFEALQLVPKPTPFTVLRPPNVWKGRIYVDNPTPPPDPFPYELRIEPRLKAVLKLSVAQYNKVDYRVYAAAYDAKGQLLGTAMHIEPVEYVRLGAMPVMFREVELNFGVSEAFSKAKYVAFAVSNPPVAKPPDGD